MSSVTIEVQAQIQWRASRSEQTHRWVGVCEPLNLVTEADSLDELYSVINETIQLLMIDLLEDDELDRYLQEHGWHAINVPPPQEASEATFDVPWELIAEGARDSERRPH